jgi:hypothetical protein
VQSNRIEGQVSSGTVTRGEAMLRVEREVKALHRTKNISMTQTPISSETDY